jgi:3-hexulose-6-phosphate synthase
MDVLTVEAALDLAGKVAESVDIIELGTPLIKNAGLSAVTAVKTPTRTRLSSRT